MQEPLRVHWERALWVLTYIKWHEHLAIDAYLNNEYASDNGDCKSTTSYCAYIYVATFSLGSHKGIGWYFAPCCVQ